MNKMEKIQAVIAYIESHLTRIAGPTPRRMTDGCSICTRAMHKLTLLYTGEPPEFVKGAL